MSGNIDAPVKVIAAFIDILGFSNLIEQSEENWGNAMEKLHKIEEHIEANFLINSFEGATVRIFSDNVYFSIPISENINEKQIYDIAWFVRQIYELQWFFLDSEIFIRGGVAVGTQYISNTTLFGTALLKAYRAESQQAKYPRIILGESLIELLTSLNGCTPIRNCGCLYTKDNEGITYMDYMSLWDDWSWEEDFKHKIFVRHRDIIANQITTISDKKILEKYKWLIEYHNTYAKKYNCEIHNIDI